MYWILDTNANTSVYIGKQTIKARRVINSRLYTIEMTVVSTVEELRVLLDRIATIDDELWLLLNTIYTKAT